MPRAVPNRQSPFQEVSAPGAHQLPSKVKVTPSPNSKTAAPAASPAYQLQDGL